MASLVQLFKNACSPNPWVTCFCVVNFDLEYGPNLEETFPETNFSEEEKTNISFLSLPDSNSTIESDTAFCFRFRNTSSPNNFYYGFSFFRQQRDSTNLRGFMQKSIVLISPLPLFSVFRKIILQLGPLYFLHGIELLETAFRNIATWPQLKDTEYFELPVLGSVIEVNLPKLSLIPNNPDNLSRVNLACLRNIPYDLWHLWEIVLTAKPLVVLCNSPVISTEVILSLLALIQPINFAGDYRTYFTINDSDFKDYSEYCEEEDLPHALIGVTNPFFLKAFEHWPNFLIVSTQPAKPQSSVFSRSFSNFGLKNRSNQFNNISVKEMRSELRTNCKNTFDIDKQVIKNITSFNDAPSDLQAIDIAIREHFIHITCEFLIPIETYFATLVPNESYILSNFQIDQLPTVRAFDQEEFIANYFSISRFSFLTDINMKKSKQVDLYKRFLLSPNFDLWLNVKCNEAKIQIEINYLKGLNNIKIENYLKEKQTVDILDLYLKIHQLNVC
eukprot:TRINITY_DN2875_c2_g1_i1.p1 TRINITY_DN2875_c2_g1~~TRINITY_DN2875_c2_g1_i1.p1  ORF type:complete len:502 (-),score=177.34 TRINITY_DN2875_c2_g1_i1:21-1526(-)